MKILCLFVRHGSAAYPDALPRLNAWYDRHGLRDQRILWILDNQLNPDEAPREIEPGTILYPGDNSSWEFSAWERGIKMVRQQGLDIDLIHLVTSAFNAHYTGYLDYFNPAMLDHVAEHKICLGHIDRYEQPVRLEGQTLVAWIRTCFFFLPARTATSLSPWTAYRDPSAFFASDSSREFSASAPLAPRHRERITHWLSGEMIGGHRWLSREAGNPATNAGLFQRKTLAILNEQRLSLTLNQAGVHLADFAWLWSLRATPRRDWPAAPSESTQVGIRNQIVWERLPHDLNQEILRELPRVGFFSGASRFHLEKIPGNPVRNDRFNRARFLVRAENGTGCFLTVGWNLTDLWHRTLAFTDACPDITCRPLFRHQAGLLDYVGMECFNGEPLETAVQENRLSPEQARAAVKGIVDGLERSQAPSNESAAREEVEILIADATALPFLDKADRDLILRLVVPLVRASVLNGPYALRWTNGDLIPANILISPSGETRLIDYEFATCTHFAAHDWWRWRTISRIHDRTGDLPIPAGFPEPSGRGHEALFILNQFVLSNRVVDREQMTTALQYLIRRLIIVAAESQDEPGTSFLLRSLIKDVSMLPALLKRTEELEYRLWLTEQDRDHWKRMNRQDGGG